MKIVYLPIEQGVRETAGRVQLARTLAANGFTAIVAPRRLLMSATSHLAPGVFIDTNMLTQTIPPQSGLDVLADRRRQGLVNACIDEEGFVVGDINQFVRTRLGKQHLQLLDIYYAVGDPTGAATQALCGKSSTTSVVVTGNPRTDLWRSNFDGHSGRGSLAQKDGTSQQHILMVSSFAGLNHLAGRNFYKSQLTAYGWLDDPKSAKFVNDRLDRLAELKNLFVATIEALATMTEMPIVVRPHPAESLDAWTDLASRFDQVRVEVAGSITPLIRNASAVVHVGSTAALEAFLGGKPVLQLGLSNGGLDSADVDTTNIVSHTILEPPSDLEEWRRLLDCSLKDREGRENALRSLVYHDGGASLRIARHLGSYDVPMVSSAETLRCLVELCGLDSYSEVHALASRVFGTARNRLRAASGVPVSYGATAQARQYYRSRDRLTSYREMETISSSLLHGGTECTRIRSYRAGRRVAVFRKVP